MSSAERLRYNPFDPVFHEDPYPMYARLRREDPVHRSHLGAWIVTRYAETREVVTREEFVTDRVSERIRRQTIGGDDSEAFSALIELTSKFVLYLDPPVHTRIRGVLRRAFSSQAARRMRGIIDREIAALLESLEGSREIDFMSEFAGPLPVRVISSLLGVPREDRKRLHGWIKVLAQILESPAPHSRYEEMDEAAGKIRDYLGTLIEQRARRPGDDITSEIARESDALTPSEMVSSCALLFMAGEETTVNGLGNGLEALFRFPEQWNRVCKHPEILGTGIDELLRFESPIQMIKRLAGADTELGGIPIRRGDAVVAVVGAANRDEVPFPDPDRLDLARDAREHLAFGGGIHQCLGGFLARAQMLAAFRELARRFPGMGPGEAPRKRHSGVALRGFDSLPVRLRP